MAKRQPSWSEGIGAAAAPFAGGIAAALVLELIERVGVKPTTAALGVAVTGGAGAAMTRGPLQLAAAGAAVAGAARLAQLWFAPSSPTTAVPEQPSPSLSEVVLAHLRATAQASTATSAEATEPPLDTAEADHGAQEPPPDPDDDAPPVEPRLIIKEPIGGIRLDL